MRPPHAVENEGVRRRERVRLFDELQAFGRALGAVDQRVAQRVQRLRILRVELDDAFQPRLGFIDVNPVLFDAEGNPRLKLYRDDLLHFYPPAYVEFTKIIRPVIEKAWSRRR